MAIRTRLLVATTLVVGLLAACAGPQYTYITNRTDHTYLKVPRSWQKVDEGAIDAALGLDPTVDDAQRGLWIQAYDSAPAPSADHLFGLQTDDPALLVVVQQVPAQMRGQYSLDKLRDFFVSVSPTARQNAALSGGGPPITVVSDQVLTPGGGLRGIHEVFRVQTPLGQPQIFDQTAYLNDDASTVYLFFVRCSASCFQQRDKEIGSVVSSYTVREKP